MTKGVALLGCGILVAVLILVVGGFVTDRSVAIALAIVALLGLLALYWADRRRKANDETRAAAYASERFEKLAAAARAHDFELRVDAASQIMLTGLLLFIGGMLLGAGILSENPTWALGGGVVAAAGAMLLLRSVPAVGRPKLVLSREGFSTPLTPLLPWSVVHGMDLETVRGRDENILLYKLLFYIPLLPEHLPRFGLFHRLLYPLHSSAGRQRLVVPLRGPSEPAEAVYDLALLLWEKATGRRNDPSPLSVFARLYPDEPSSPPSPEIAALRRDTEAALSDGAEKNRMLADLAELEADNRRIERYQTAIRAAWRERQRRALYCVFACPPIAGALLYFGVHWGVSAFVAVPWLVSLYVSFFEKEGSVAPAGHAAGILATLQRNPNAEAEIYRAYGRAAPRKR